MKKAYITEDFYGKRKYNIYSDKDLETLAEDILFYCKYRTGSLSFELEAGTKRIKKVLKNIITTCIKKEIINKCITKLKETQ